MTWWMWILLAVVAWAIFANVMERRFDRRNDR